MIALTGRRGVLALAATQIAGWGSTYFVPAMLVGPISGDLGLSPAFVFSGVTIQLIVGAFTGPSVGVHVDRYGPRLVLAIGSACMAVGLVVLGLSGGLVGFVVAWSIMGLGMPMVLIQTPFAAAAMLVPGMARRAIGLMTLVGSLTTLAFLPAMALLDGPLGWRGICFLFAGVQALVCLPLHAAIHVRPIARDTTNSGDSTADDGIADPVRRRRAFWAMAVAFSCVGFVTWGLPLHLVDLSRAYGEPEFVSVAVGAIMGPAQMAARALEATFGHRVPILRLGFFSLLTILGALALPLVFGGGALTLILMVIGYGFGAGVNTIVRAIAPLIVFGRSGYASVLGKLGLPLNLVFATAPFAIAEAIERGGPQAGVALCAVAIFVSMLGMAVLRRIAAGVGGA
ncbi:MAG: MFS transporter [Alphaproteobacteria bacterium]|nr:MFS transporter [Alphaproteobacteria bacterium]